MVMIIIIHMYLNQDFRDIGALISIVGMVLFYFFTIFFPRFLLGDDENVLICDLLNSISK